MKEKKNKPKKKPKHEGGGERNRSGRRNCSVVKEEVEVNNGTRDLRKNKWKECRKNIILCFRKLKEVIKMKSVRKSQRINTEGYKPHCSSQLSQCAEWLTEQFHPTCKIFKIPLVHFVTSSFDKLLTVEPNCSSVTNLNRKTSKWDDSGTLVSKIVIIL